MRLKGDHHLSIELGKCDSHLWRTGIEDSLQERDDTRLHMNMKFCIINDKTMGERGPKYINS